MGDTTGIQWTNHTWNPWRGCAKVSEGCLGCYAETLARRNPAVLGTWGADGTRPRASESYWMRPFHWDKQAQAAGERRRVFCLSLGDWLEDREDLDPLRARLLWTVLKTPHLDWLLLTKRPEKWDFLLRRTRQAAPLEFGGNDTAKLITEWLGGNPPANVWPGTSVENQRWAHERISFLQEIPAKLRFLSVEPLLGPINLSQRIYRSVLTGVMSTPLDGIGWVIVGGESDQAPRKARPFDIHWARDLRDQCRNARVPFFMKQLGSHVENCDIIDAMDAFPGMPELSPGSIRHNARVHLQDSHGGDPSEWPEDLNIREFPVFEQEQNVC